MPTKDRQKRMRERQRKATTTSYQTSNENLQSQSQAGAHENVPSSPMQGPISQSRSLTCDATKTSVLPSNDNLHSQGPPAVHQPGAHENVPSSPLQRTVSQSRSRTCDRDTSTVMSTNSMPLALLATSPQAILNGREIDINLIDHLSDLLRHQFHVDEGHGLIHPSHILGCLMNRERLTHIIRSNSVGMQIHFIDQHFVMSQQTDTEIIVFDSLYNSSRIQRLRPQLRLLYERVQVNASYRVRYVVPQEQGVRPDCGCFAVCNALLLLQQINPSTVQLEQVSLRQFLLQTIRMGTFGRIPMSNSYGSQLQRYFFHQKQNQLIRQKRWDVHPDCHQEVGSKPDSDRLKSQNALRIKKCKLNYTEEQKKKIKDSDRQRKAFSTQQMSAQERENIKQNTAASMRKLRTQATPEKKDSMKDTDRKRKMSAKQQMSAQERETIKQNTAASMRNLRTQATPEKMDSMKDKDCKRKMSAKQQMSAQERETIKQNTAASMRNLRTQATPEKMDSMQDKDRKRKMSAKQQMSAQERETIKQNTAASMRNLRTQATPEKMDSMKDTDRKRKMSAKQQMSAQERETIKQNTAASMRNLRTQATPEKMDSMKDKDRKRKISAKQQMSAQERENIKQKAADGRRKLRTQAIPEKKDSMKDTDRKRKMSAKQQMSAQERETIKQNTAASMRNLRTQATPEKMDSMKDTDRKRKMSAKQQMSAQERETIKQNTAASMRKLRTQATPEKAKHRKTVDRHRKASQRHHLSEVEGNDREFLLNQTKKAYKKAITTGPVYVCVCCIRLMYRTSVILYCQEKYSPDVTFFLPVEDSLSFDGRYYICTTCDRYLKKQKIPPQSQQNSLSLDVQPPELKSLSDLEARLISKRLLFMKVLALPSGKQRAIFGSVVNVPVEVERTCGSLPRTLSEASVISLKLKRKLSYHGHQLCQLVRPSAIMNALQWLKVNNALYSDIIVNTQTGSHIEETTERIINPEEVHHTNSVESTPAEHSTERSQTTDCEDPEPSEDNHNTQWEADNASDSAEESSIQDSNKDKETSGQSMITPEEMDHTESVENLSGKEQSTERNQTKDYKDPEPSEDQQRGIQYSTCLQPEELSSHTSNTYSIAPGEGHQPLCIFTDPQNELFAFPQLFPTGTFGFDTVRQEKLSLRKYFQTRLLSKDSRFAQSTEYLFYSQYLTEKKQISDNVSIFLRKTSSTSDNLSLTAADVTASDHINGLVSKDRAFYLLQNIRGSPPYWRTLLYDLLAMIRQLGIFTWFLTLSAADLKWPESIQIVAAHYGQTLTAEDIAAMPWEEKCAWIRRNPVTVARHFDFRVQQFFKHFILGKPAILGEIDHYVYRVEFQQRGSPHIHCVLWVKGAPTMDSDDDTVRSFVDRFVTCSNDEEIEELVHLQTHTHSRTCQKSGKKCRFHFPKPPSSETLVCHKSNQDQASERQESSETYRKTEDVDRETLKKVWGGLENLQESNITVEHFLNVIGVSLEQYKKALASIKSNDHIVLKRELTELNINNYNKDILTVWEANMDIQYVCSPYECISYIAFYVTKDEREMGQILQAAASEASSGNIRQQLNKIGHKFLTHRELSAQEATFRILSLPLKRSSTDVVYVATGFPDERLRLLKPKKDLQDMDGTSQDIFVSNMIERYKYRPHTVDDMCLASFVSNYKIQSVKDTADSDHVNILETDEVSESKLILLENHGVVRKRIKPAVVRTHRYSQDKESERYYHSILMLYSPWRYEEIDLKGQFSSYEEMYVSKKDEIDTMRSAFEHNSDIIDEVLDDPDHFQNEDAWDQLAPSAQQQKAHDQASSPEIDENFPLYPDPEHSHNLEYPTHDIEINKQLIPDDEYMAIIRTLNSAQKAVFDFILNWCSCVVHSRKKGSKPDPFHIFMSGGAGTGKSHVIKAIFQMVKRILRVEGDDPDDPTIILTAPTGTAAFNIEGVTIHHGLSLPCEKTNRYISLSSNKLNTLRCKFLNLQIIVIDEISMVGCNMLYTIHRRLSDIKGCKDIFGGVSILAVGDLSQLPPIGDPPIYRQPSDPYAALYGSLWQNHFKIICLTEIMRQRENKEFAELLNRIRSNETTPQDIELLQTRCFEAQECQLDILYVFTTNDAVNAHNTRMLQTLTTPKLLVKAIDSKKDVDTSCVDVEVPEKHTKSGGLRKELTIAVGARVMVTKNVDTDDGIVNGSVGTVVGYLPEPTPDGFDSFQPKYILVQFDNPSVGEKRKQQLSLHLQNFPSAVPIGRETVKFTVGKRHIRSERTQFPLTLSWACTIHKVQGLTVPKIAVSFKGTFRDGQAYVALSRVQKLADLFLLDFKKQAIRVSNEVIEERKRMVSTSSLDLKDLFMNTRLVDIHTESISFGYVNIRSLKAHLLDIQLDANFSQCAISCFTETWLKPTDNFSSFELNQRVFRKDRSEVFQETPENAAFLSHGGLLAVASENLCPTNTSDAYPSQELECLSFHVAQPVPFTTLLVYKSPTMPKQIFLNKLNIVLKQIKGSLILIGDFNINMMNKSASKSFRTLTTTHQLTELFEQPTHATGSQLDNVFSRALHVRPLLNRPVHFSDHNALFFTIQPRQSSHQHM